MTMMKLVNFYFAFVDSVFKTYYLQIPEVGGIFTAQKCLDRIEDIEKRNPYKSTIDETGHFTADITEDIWNQIHDPTTKKRKKLRKNWIEVRKYKTL